MWVGIIQSSEGLNRTKSWRMGIFAHFSWAWPTFFSCSQTSILLAFGLRPGLTLPPPLVLRPLDLDWIMLRPFLLLLEMADCGTCPSRLHEPIPITHFLLNIPIHTLFFLFLWRKLIQWSWIEALIPPFYWPICVMLSPTVCWCHFLTTLPLRSHGQATITSFLKKELCWGIMHIL